MKIVDIAKICHEANKHFCESLGDYTQKPWEYAADWQRESAVKGVEFTIKNPNAPDSAQHDSWMLDKINNGWVYGDVKDETKKTHPCLVAFENLPPEQQAKDALFKSICLSLIPLIK